MMGGETNRRSEDVVQGEILALVRTSLESIGNLERRIGHLDQRLTAHMQYEEKIGSETNMALQKLTSDVKVMSGLIKAFPAKQDGTPDIEGHHNDHFSRMTEATETKNWWKNLKRDLATKAIYGIIMFILFILALGFKDWVIQKVTEKTTVEAPHAVRNLNK